MDSLKRFTANSARLKKAFSVPLENSFHVLSQPLTCCTNMFSTQVNSNLGFTDETIRPFGGTNLKKDKWAQLAANNEAQYMDKGELVQPEGESLIAQSDPGNYPRNLATNKVPVKSKQRSGFSKDRTKNINHFERHISSEFLSRASSCPDLININNHSLSPNSGKAVSFPGLNHTSNRGRLGRKIKPKT